MALKQDMEWRYATKNYNGETLPQEKLDYLLDTVRLSASSMGLQPYKILVIRDESIRARIREISWNQPQVTDSSHLIVFAAWTDFSVAKVDDFIGDIAKKRGVPETQLKDFRDMIAGKVTQTPPAELAEWAARQTYIALGTLLAAAAEQRIDATPMEGFDSAALDAILGLPEKKLASSVMAAVGYRAPDDWLAPLAKVRRDPDQLFEFI